MAVRIVVLNGLDDKLIAMPLEKIDPFQAEIQDLQDLPTRRPAHPLGGDRPLQ